MSANASYGSVGSTAYNSIIYGNNNGGAQVSSTVCSYCCVGGTLLSGEGNISADPLFVDPVNGDYRLQVFSLCKNAGNDNKGTDENGTDLDGNKRHFGPHVDMGAYESHFTGVLIHAGVSGGGTISPSGSFSWESLPVSQLFTAAPLSGRTFSYFSTNGIAIPNTGNTITLVAPIEDTITLTAHFEGTLYADANRQDDSGDGTTPATAKRTLQAAVDLAYDYETIMVAPGIYDEGQRVTPDERATGYLLNRLMITNNITVQSTEGAEQTIIVGAKDPASTDSEGQGRGPDAIRCVYITKGSLQGFTITGGATDLENTENENNRGGGVYVSDDIVFPIISDCIISNNAAERAGGAMNGTFRRCAFIDNFAYQNSSAIRGGKVYDCLVTGNRIGTSLTGGAVGYSLNVFNCTIADNEGNSADQATLYNCILSGETGGCKHFTCCLSSVTGSKGLTNCFFANPLFVNAAASDYRLTAESPCLDIANMSYVDDWTGTDQSGSMRMQNAQVDLGALERDWRPDFAAALDGSGITVTEVTSFVTHITNSLFFGASAVNLDGEAALTYDQDSVEMNMVWPIPGALHSFTYNAEVTGNGTLQVYENTTLILTADLNDGLQNLKHSTVQNPSNLRFVYTPETGDTGGAVLDAFDLNSGLLIIIN